MIVAVQRICQCVFAVVLQEKVYAGPVLKKEWHFNNIGGDRQSACLKTAARLEWDTHNLRVRLVSRLVCVLAEHSCLIAAFHVWLS